MLDSIIAFFEQLVYVPDSGMVHPGLPPAWVAVIFFTMLLLAIRYTVGLSATTTSVSAFRFSLQNRLLQWAVTHPYLLLLLKLFSVAVFLLVIYAGLFGTPVPERNLATTLTWTIWWSGVIVSIFFLGSAWCAICPWDAIANWLVKRRLWKRASVGVSLNMRVPRLLRSVWPALLMFVVLTWLELGVGVTVSPYATALLALLMVVLATLSLLLYERKAFCRYFCAIGRTIGVYSSMAPIALRPVNSDICERCETLECYHGTDEIEPCPTHLVMGKITQNTYCTSCGSCSMSCPQQNVSWQLRGIGSEITQASRTTAMRARVDEAGFILGLVALTTFHGITMMPYWENWISRLAWYSGDSGSLLLSFSLAMLVAMSIPVLLYLLVIRATRQLSRLQDDFKRIFSALAISILPLAFTYHIAHNLTHLVRESNGFWNVVANPLGTGTAPLSMMEKHMRHMNPLLDDSIVFALQGLLVLFGFWLAVYIARQRYRQLHHGQRASVAGFMPILLFVLLVSLANLWLLMQPMIMRM